jgi:dolichyl-phosphate beta-glucosyltransferase
VLVPTQTTLRTSETLDICMRTLLVVPCFDEEARLDVTAVIQFLEGAQQTGIIFVNDGSRDGTLKLLNQVAQQFPRRVVVIDQGANKGKAEAVRVGMLRAMDFRVEYAGYFDADLATPLESSAEFVETLDKHTNLQFVIGARVALLGRTITRRASRHYTGRIFATVASLVLALPVYDTQCGAKLMRVNARARSLFEKPFGSRWIFDVELFARYLAVYGDRNGLYELPLLRWSDVGESKIKWHDFMRASAEIASIYRAYGIKRDFDSFLRLLTAPFLRYVGAGGVGTLCHYLVLTILVTLFAVTPAAATVAGALVGAGINYLLNYHFTFASSATHRTTLPRFLMVATLSAVLNGVGMWFATSRLGLHYLVSQLGCTAVVLVVGYLLNAAWTFRTYEQLPPD